MNKQFKSTEEWELELGEQFRNYRLRLNLGQIELAERANVGLSALKNLESGKGATLKTLIKVTRALGRTDWLEALHPQVSISPLQIAKFKRARKRASSPRVKLEIKKGQSN